MHRFHPLRAACALALVAAATAHASPLIINTGSANGGSTEIQAYLPVFSGTSSSGIYNLFRVSASGLRVAACSWYTTAPGIAL